LILDHAIALGWCRRPARLQDGSSPDARDPLQELAATI
jgi:hypothetical protein